MTMKWKCTKCGTLASDGLPDDPKLAAGIAPLVYPEGCVVTTDKDEVCGGKLKAHKSKKK